ncbi:matrilin-3-like [Glandiceps talaboti]
MKLCIVILGFLLNQCHGLSLGSRISASLDGTDGITDTAAYDTAESIGTHFLGKFSPASQGRGFFGKASPPPVDLLYVIDKSGSIGTTDFTKSIDLVKQLIDLFPVPISPDETRIAAISFSSAHKVDLDFNFLACANKDACKDAIGRIDFEDGSTHTGRALNLARTNAFTNAAGSRSNAHKVLFLITDGRSNGGLSVTAAANALKDTGVEIYALGVTDSINRDELRSIVSVPVPDHLFYYESFAAMGRGTSYLQSIFGVASGSSIGGGGFFGLQPVIDRQPISRQFSLRGGVA